MRCKATPANALAAAPPEIASHQMGMGWYGPALFVPLVSAGASHCIGEALHQAGDGTMHMQDHPSRRARSGASLQA